MSVTKNSCPETPKHYNTVIKIESLFASETLAMNRKGEMEDIKNTEWNINIRKILGPNKMEEGYRQRSWQEAEWLSTYFTTKKRRLRFLRHIKRMENPWLTKQIIEYMENIKNKGWIT